MIVQVLLATVTVMLTIEDGVGGHSHAQQSCDQSCQPDSSDGYFFNSMLTPPAILDNANIGQPYSLTSKGELLFKNGQLANSRLLRIPLARAGQLNGYKTIIVDVTYSHRNPTSSATSDMDPRVVLSDGVSAVGFYTHDKANFGSFPPLMAIEGLSGYQLGSPRITSDTIRVHSEPATVHSLHFRLEPQLPASCVARGSYDREVSIYHKYTKTLHPERGLYLEVYRNNVEEQYIFSFFKIQAHVERLV